MPLLPADQLTALLESLLAGTLDVPQVVARLAGPATPTTDPEFGANIDFDRLRRCGYPEVIYAPGKSPELLVEIFRRLHGERQSCFATRITGEQAAAVATAFPAVTHNALARTLRLDPAGSEMATSAVDAKTPGFVAVITAGASDRPVAEEALETARWMGCRVDLIVDVGVAGPHRLPAQKHRFERADAIVVVAGMEAALPSVVGGYVSCPVIGVPTSVGYGANFQGLAALLGMINSCAANVTVVNIDAGFKGGFIAGLIAQGRSAR